VNRAAIVLCGGKSRRMGCAKAWLRFGSETMLQRIVRVVSQEVTQVIVVAAAEQELPELPPAVSIVRDRQPERGPLEGLACGLQALPHDFLAYATSCDVPGLQSDFVRAMLDLAEGYDIAVPQDGSYFHPLAAVYRASVLSDIEELLAAGQLRPRALFSRVSTRVVPTEHLRKFDAELDSLVNLNEPSDYDRAVRAAGFTVDQTNAPADRLSPTPPDNKTS